MPPALEIPTLALGLIALFGVAGWGVLQLTVPTLPADVRGALAPVTGVAAFSTVAAFTVTRLPPTAALALALGVPLLCTALAALRAPRVRERVESRMALAAVVLIAAVFASVPVFAHGDGRPATWGNADPYLWVSQAKSILSGPPPEPASRFPDRIAYDHLAHGGWAPGLPALTAVAAAGAREDPVDVFGAVVALLYALTPLVTFAIARLALGWSARLSIGAAAVVAVSPYRLYSSYYGWQPQIAGVACLLAAALLFRKALDGGARRRHATAAAALLVAGALGIYRLPFLPYVVFVLGLVAVGFALSQRAAREAAWGAAELVLATAILAAPSLGAFVLHAPTFWQGGNDSAAWDGYVRGLPSEALGLMPRAPDLGEPYFGDIGIVVLVLALAILAVGLRALLRCRSAQRDLVVALAGGSLAAILVAQLPVFNPYYSIKLDGYATVPLTLAALAVLSGRLMPAWKVALPAMLLAVSIALVTREGLLTLSVSAHEAPSAATAHSRRVITIGYRSSWRQMWAVYFNRSHPASVTHPSDYLTRLGVRDAAH